MDIIKLWEKSFQNDAQSLILLAFHYEKGDSVDENKDLTAELLNEAKTVPQYEKIRVVSI